jgi:hypothetical protein
VGTSNTLDVTFSNNVVNSTDASAPAGVNVTSRRAGTACYDISGNDVNGPVSPSLVARQGGTVTANLSGAGAKFRGRARGRQPVVDHRHHRDCRAHRRSLPIAGRPALP